MYRIMQRRERWRHCLPSRKDDGTANMQLALWLDASVPVPVARPGASSRYRRILAIGHENQNRVRTRDEP